MIHLLMSLMIVAVLPAASDPATDPDAVQVFACDFESADKVSARAFRPAGRGAPTPSFRTICRSG